MGAKNGGILDPYPHPQGTHYLVSGEKGILKANTFLPSSGGNGAEQTKRKRGVKILKVSDRKEQGLKGGEEDRVQESGQHSARAARRQHSPDAVCW